MKTTYRNNIQSVALSIAMIAVLAVLAGCERDEQTVDTAEDQAVVDQRAEDQRTEDRRAEDEPAADRRAADRRADDQRPADQRARDQRAADQQPMEHSAEFDGFTLRANVSRTDVLPDDMAQKYGIEPESDLVLLNVMILENRADRQSAPVSADVSAQYESLSGHVETIDMREVEANGHVSYIGTLDASDQRSFELHIEAHTEGADEPLHMTFEVELKAFETGDSEYE